MDSHCVACYHPIRTQMREAIKDIVRGNAIDYTAKRIGCFHQAVFDSHGWIDPLPAIAGSWIQLQETFMIFKKNTWLYNMREDIDLLNYVNKPRLIYWETTESCNHNCIHCQCQLVKNSEN